MWRRSVALRYAPAVDQLGNFSKLTRYFTLRKATGAIGPNAVSIVDVFLSSESSPTSWQTTRLTKMDRLLPHGARE